MTIFLLIADLTISSLQPIPPPATTTTPTSLGSEATAAAVATPTTLHEAAPQLGAAGGPSSLGDR